MCSGTTRTLPQGGPLETPALSPMALLLPVYAGGANAALKYGALGSVAAASLLSGLDRRLQLAAHEESQRRLACYRRDPQAVDYDVNGHHGHGTAEASLALAWKAYEGAKGGTRLPGLETYSSDQLFFVAFAYQHCAAADYGAQEYRHVHAAVRNLDAFGHAFACDPGTPMNPTHKCSYF
ncbi:endothelin-converting enzyme-like 1 [Haemaphysalis longicornis]